MPASRVRSLAAAAGRLLTAVYEIATGAEVAAGSDNTKAVSPKATKDAQAFQSSSGSGSWAPNLATGTNFKRTATGGQGALGRFKMTW